VKPVKDITVGESPSISHILESMREMGGFMGRQLGVAFKIWREILDNRDDIVVLMSFPAAIVSTGLRGLIREVVDRGWVDIIITTCGTWDHDLARSYVDYYEGDFYMDDKRLRVDEVHRLGNVLIPFDNYGSIIQEKIEAFLGELYGEGVRRLSTSDFSRRLGMFINRSESLLTSAAQKDVKVIVPAPYDGAVGYNIWVFQQFHRDFTLDLYLDEKYLMDVVYDAKKTAGIIIGGGVSKHHLIWWNQFRGGLDYAIQLSTAIEYDGSLSGARLSEAVSWNKVGLSAKYVSVWGDATYLLPFLVAGLVEEGF